MPDIFKPLFNHHLLHSRMSGFDCVLSDEQKRIVADWVRAANDPTFCQEKEKPHQGEFLLQLFGSLLGYIPYIGHAEDYNLKAESASKETKGGKTPDGRLGFFGKEKDVTRAVIELKAPAANIDLKQQGHGGLTPVEQGFGYVPKFDGCRWVIISNFISIRLYSTARGQAYCHEWQIADFACEEALRKFVFLLHRDRLIIEMGESSFTGKIASDTHTQEEKITKDFYAFYKGVRLRLFHQLVRDNPAPAGTVSVDHEVWLLEQAQKVLDRVLFICFCEDKGLLPHGVIRKAIEAADGAGGFVRTTRWQQMTGLFHAIDKGNPPLGINGYNGGLFAEDFDLDALIVSEETLDDCLRLSEYDFDTDLNVNILGHIFEQSISDLENLRAEIQGESIDRTKSKRKKEGVFYTPEYITRFIVENTIGSYLQERFAELEAKIAPEKVRGKNKQQEAYERLWTEYQDLLRSIKVLDPACGSGAFLVAAFDYLHAEYLRVNAELAALRDGQASLFDLDKQILQENLFGVDINHESVEITKLSLWLKTANKGKPLNNLDGNIKCGNSLIDSDSDTHNEMSKLAYAMLPPEVRAKAFEWRKQFPQVFAAGGFDCVIGNPPYIRQEWLAPIKPYIEKEYKSFSGTADIYMYFIEKGIRLLRQNGKLGFITSGTFARANFATAFRQWLPSCARFHRIVNFGENQPFEDAEMVYPTISIIEKRTDTGSFRSLFLYERIPDSLDAAMEEEGVVLDERCVQQSEWTFHPSYISDLLARLHKQCKSLSDLVNGRIFNGVKTGLNEAFIIDEARRKQLVDEHPECSGIMKKLLRGEDLRPWYVEDENRWLIFARRGIEISKYPSICRHLEAFRDRLEPKPNGHMGTWTGRKSSNYAWYEIEASIDYFQYFETPKIYWPEIGKLPRFSLDAKGTYANNKAYFLVPNSPALLAILQSRVIWFCISQIATPLRLRGGLWQYQCFKQFIERLPIPDVTKIDEDALADLAMRATEIANERYALHEKVRARILTDLGGGTGKLNQKLTAWYDLPANSFRAEVKKAFKQDIPLKERSDWESTLADWQAEHQRLTAKLVDVETEINDRVYKLYGLSAADIQILEDHMKKTMIFYPLGEV